MGWFTEDPLQIITFQSYGGDGHFYIRGRALEDERIDLTKKGFFSVLKHSWNRFKSDEVAHAKLRVKLPDGTFFYTETNAKGYFKLKTLHTGLRALTNEEGWLPYEISFDTGHPGKIISNENRFPGEMLIPAENSSFGIISDIDDTIVHTGLTSFLKLKLIFNTFLRHAENRIPLEGASAFYHLLHRGSTGSEANPCFYVSHGPWNLYRYLELFLQVNAFPKGPILLRDFPMPFRKKDLSEKPQKQQEILAILTMYPELPFILIGDSGERDADIYIEIAAAFPERIKAIYLRSVRHKKKMVRVKGLFQDYNTTPVLLVEKSREAIAHAREHGFIR